MSKQEMSQIIDGVYFQKLGVILTKLQDWQKKKNNLIDEVYADRIGEVIQKMRKSDIDMRNQMNQFIRLLNLQYSFLSKLKKEDKIIQISPLFKEFKQFSDQFGIVKDSLLNLQDFLSKFIGITSYEFTELKRIYQEAEQIKYRYDQYRIKISQIYNQKKQLICSKKNIRKHFQLSKILNLLGDLQKDRDYHNELSFRLLAILQKQNNHKQKMYKDICDNLQYISTLYQKCFKRDLLNKLKKYFKDKLALIQKEKERLSLFKLDKSLPQKIYLQIEEQFYKDFDNFLTEITIASWNITYVTKTKQSIQRQQPTIVSNMILTFDNKIVFYGPDKTNIDLQVSLQDLKVSQPTADGKIQIKNRKNKQRMIIKFNTVEKEDEFYLHCQQVALKC